MISHVLKLCFPLDVISCCQAEQAKKYLQEAEEECKTLEMPDGHDYPRKQRPLAP